MRNKIFNKATFGVFGIILAIFALSFASAIVVNADYIILFPGEEGRITVEIENNENFDIESVSISLELGSQKIFNEFGVVVSETEALPFTVIRSSERDVDDIDEDDEESVSFTLRANTDITPGDYNIPYAVKFVNAENDSETFEKEGSFGIRVSAKTEIDFSVDLRDNAIVGREGKVSLEIINKGLGEIKSVSVLILPNGFELLSKNKIFIGTIDADDTDLATFDVIYKTSNPVFSAKIEYKDFDNNNHVETISIPFKVYTEEKALELGIIKKSKTLTYGLSGGVVVLAWFVWRRIKKKRKNRG
ncbi:MAG TPA: hypothetical protein ENI22_00135 [Candidatus Pacearchaeota archaeon]|nr:hypothetical protein [Candidatus Pacearchaeota archaeon]